MANDKPPADGWKIGLKESDQARIEAHHTIGPGVAVELAAKGRDPAPEVAVDLDLEQQRDAVADQAEQAAQRRDGPIADPQPCQLAVCRSADPQRARAHPPRVGVMENDDLVVGGQTQVALDARASLKGRGEGEQAVLGKPRTVMQAAVREARWAGIEWIRP